MGSTHLWNRARWLVILVAGATTYGVVGYMGLEGWSFADALYMTVLALSTVGFREVRPLDTSGRIFTITLIMLGVAIVLVTVSVIAAWVSDERLGQARRRRRMQKRLDDRTDHFIICAYGRVGRAVARDFESEGVPFVVVDIDEELEQRMNDDGVDHLIGDPSLEPVLRSAGVGRARGLICAVDSDATNVYIALLARSMNPDLLIVARASEPGSDARLLSAGADRVVSPFVSSGRHMALMALHPSIVDVLEVGHEAGHAKGGLWVQEILVDGSSSLDGRTVAEGAGSAAPLAIRHADGTVTSNPAGDLPLRSGDLLLVLGEEDSGGA
ncbi:MAG: potassium channel protein [Actinomycetota bacterium]